MLATVYCLLPTSSHSSFIIPHSSFAFLHFLNLTAQLLDAREEFLVAALLARRRVSLDEERAAGLEHACLYVVEAREPLPVRDRLKLRHGQKLARESFTADLAFLDERGRLAFEQLIEPSVLEHEAHDDVVCDEQRDRADQPARDAVVAADNRVLHRVRQRQKDDEVEGVELRKLSLAEDAQQKNEHCVDDYRPQNLLEERKLRPREHVRESSVPKEFGHGALLLENRF